MVNISEISVERPTSYFNDLEEKIFSLFERLKIDYEYVFNDVVETMEECIEIDKALNCEIRKSILLTNKKHTTFFLVVLPAKKNLDVKLLEKKIGISGLSFASGEEMKRILGVIPGSLTVLSVISDLDDYVQVIIDKEILDSKYFACNTGTNQRHIKIKTGDLIRYLKHIHHKMKEIEF